MFKFKLVNRQKCLDNMKINGASSSPKLGDSTGKRYRSELKVFPEMILAKVSIQQSVSQTFLQNAEVHVHEIMTDGIVLIWVCQLKRNNEERKSMSA